jgi:hypothetical protein
MSYESANVSAQLSTVKIPKSGHCDVGLNICPLFLIATYFQTNLSSTAFMRKDATSFSPFAP